VELDPIRTTAEVAERYQVKPATVQDLYQKGKLEGFPLGGTKGGRLRFRESALLRFEGREGPRFAIQPEVVA
jgi:hypothetical protein